MNDDSSISPIDRYKRQRVAVNGTEMADVDTGTGDPVVFLHGNPTSSYLWRNVIPQVEDVSRCLAPDLIGMGSSDKAPDGRYRFTDHVCYLDAWFDALGLDRIVLICHDWGGALGFHWAARHPERVAGIIYMETIVRSMTWEEWPEAARRIFQAMRSPVGEELILQKNIFIERILPASVIRQLSEEEMDAYRRPFLEPGEPRRPMLTWPRELPLNGEPADVVKIVDHYARWLASSPVPKLFINAEPGFLSGPQREFCRTWPNQREVIVAGMHFIQEDSPVEIGQAIAEFLQDSRNSA